MYSTNDSTLLHCTIWIMSWSVAWFYEWTVSPRKIPFYCCQAILQTIQPSLCKPKLYLLFFSVSVQLIDNCSSITSSKGYLGTSHPSVNEGLWLTNGHPNVSVWKYLWKWEQPMICKIKWRLYMLIL